MLNSSSARAHLKAKIPINTLRKKNQSPITQKHALQHIYNFQEMELAST